MKNKEIAGKFGLLAKLSELHNGNPFKIRSYNSAYQLITKLPSELSEFSEEERASIDGLGKGSLAKVNALIESAELSDLNELMAKTPDGIIELIGIKGLGPKRIKKIWAALDITDPVELLYACTENRLLSLKGFGPKVQADLITKLNYHIASKGKMLYADVLDIYESIIQFFADHEIRYSVGGDMLEKNTIVTELCFIIYSDPASITLPEPFSKETDFLYKHATGFPIRFISSDKPENITVLLSSLRHVPESLTNAVAENIPPELWWMGESAQSLDVDQIITEQGIKGVIHNHTTYSDGLHSLQEMAEASRTLGYQYMVITDHSQAAFYAGGLKIDEVYKQIEEIKELNKQWSDFKLIPGTECDILSDGAMDYPDDLLNELDVVIASIHSNLTMPLDKAMNRLMTAIAHPSVHILGHMTGRLLLSRKGYPVDHTEIIDACYEHGVVIELNANPRRLDMDYTWIPYAQEKGVMVSINPDAHSVKGIEDIRYGVLAARKGGLYADNCLNTLGADELLKRLKSLKESSLTNR